MGFWSYIYNWLRGLDELGNATLDGNSRQTISSRCYEAAVLKGIWYWKIAYYAVNAGAYALRWLFARPLGYRWGEDMPVNHCMDAYLSDQKDRTYV